MNMIYFSTAGGHHGMFSTNMHDAAGSRGGEVHPREAHTSLAQQKADLWPSQSRHQG